MRATTFEQLLSSFDEGLCDIKKAVDKVFFYGSVFENNIKIELFGEMKKSKDGKQIFVRGLNQDRKEYSFTLNEGEDVIINDLYTSEYLFVLRDKQITGGLNVKAVIALESMDDIVDTDIFHLGKEIYGIGNSTNTIWICDLPESELLRLTESNDIKTVSEISSLEGNCCNDIFVNVLGYDD